MRDLDLFQSSEFTEEIDRLRVESFAGQYPSGTSRDSFDEKSRLLAGIGGELAAGARLTPEPGGFYSSCLRSSKALRTEVESIAINRVHVAPGYRGQGIDLFELIILYGLLTCGIRIQVDLWSLPIDQTIQALR